MAADYIGEHNFTGATVTGVGGADLTARKTALQNLIGQLQDHGVTYSADGSVMFGEAYIDSNGRNNSVDTTNTNASFRDRKSVV